MFNSFTDPYLFLENQVPENDGDDGYAPPSDKGNIMSNNGARRNMVPPSKVVNDPLGESFLDTLNQMRANSMASRGYNIGAAQRMANPATVTPSAPAQPQPQPTPSTPTPPKPSVPTPPTPPKPASVPSYNQIDYNNDSLTVQRAKLAAQQKAAAASAPTVNTPSAGKTLNASFGFYDSDCKAIYESVVSQYMDMGDYDTVHELGLLDEAEQNTLLLSLTNKLYKMIVGKIDDIDYGDIPGTKGNIYKLPKYKQLRECIETMHNIYVQYKEDTGPVDELDHALSNLENYRDLFIASFAGGIEIGQMIYNNTTLGVIQGLSYMIACTIAYVKDPKAKGLKIIVEKPGMKHVKDHLVYQSLCKFNKVCANGELEKVLHPLIKNRVRNFLAEFSALTVIVITLALFASAIIGWLRDLVYFFYASRVRASSYLDLQANLLEMNSKDLQENNYHTEDDKNKVIRRQLAVARMFRSLADKISVEGKDCEVKADKSIKADRATYKIDDVNTDPSVGMGSSPLF